MLKKIVPLCLVLLCAFHYSHAQKWQPGYFYDNDGAKNTGFIADYIAPPNGPDAERQFFLFKPAENAPSIRVFAANISSFVVGRDSFTVSYSKLLNETPFVQVVGNNPLKLYVARLPRQTPDFGLASGIGFMSVAVETSFPYTKNKYYYGHDEDNLTELTRKEFIDVMTRVMADNPAIAAKIKSKDYRYGDLKELIGWYQTGIEPGYNLKPQN